MGAHGNEQRLSWNAPGGDTAGAVEGGIRATSVATLNIKNFPDPLHRKLKVRARQHRRSLSQEVIEILGRAVEAQAAESILDLRGLGKHLWKGVDPPGHVAAEREW
jgi:plasmid stability protein